MSINLAKPLRLRNDGGPQLELERGGIVRGLTVLSSGTLELGSATKITGATTLDSTLTVAGDVSIADKIIHTGDTNTAIRFPAADTVTFETAGSERLRIDSSGKVGIGVASPSGFFDVRESNPSADVLVANFANPNNSTPGTSATIGLTTIGSSAATLRGCLIRAVQGSSSNQHDLLFYTNAPSASPAERMRITSAGNVGIGTSSPNGTLTIRNGSSATEQLIIGNSANTGGRDWRLGRDNVATGDLIIKSSDATNGNVTTERMRITSAGGVSIGTTTDAGAGNLILADSNGIKLANGYDQIYSGRETGITASTGTVVFTFDYNVGATYRSTLVKVTISLSSASQTASNNASGVYYAMIHTNSSNVTTWNGAASIFEYQMTYATDWAFADAGGGTATFTLTNPIASACEATWKVELIAGGNSHRLTSVTST